MTIPAEGRSRDEILAEIQSMKTQDAQWYRGRTFSLIYPTGREDVDEVLLDASNAYLYENALNPIRFPSLQ